MALASAPQLSRGRAEKGLGRRDASQPRLPSATRRLAIPLFATLIGEAKTLSVRFRTSSHRSPTPFCCCGRANARSGRRKSAITISASSPACSIRRDRTHRQGATVSFGISPDLPCPPGLTLTGTHRPIRFASPGSLRPIGRPCDGDSRHETKAHWPVGSIPQCLRAIRVRSAGGLRDSVK